MRFKSEKKQNSNTDTKLYITLAYCHERISMSFSHYFLVVVFTFIFLVSINFSIAFEMKTNSGSSFIKLKQAKELISRAISLGAPAYNAGNIAECARVYTETAKEISSLVPESFQTKLLSEVNYKEIDKKTMNFDEKAWALRRLFDSIVDYQLPIVPQKTTTTNDTNNLSFEPFSSQQLPNSPIEVMDNVMGGVSEGGWIETTNTFFGRTSLENNGGFASLRWRFPTVQNWSYAKGIYLKGLKHSNQQQHTFRMILKDTTCAQVRLSNFKTVFANPMSSDEPLLIPFEAFDQMEQMGNALVGAPAFNPSGVTEIGIMAIKPTVVGEFQLEFSEWGLYV